MVPLAENRFLAKAAARDVRRLRTISRLSSSRFRIWKNWTAFPLAEDPQAESVSHRDSGLHPAALFSFQFYLVCGFSSSEELEHLSREQILSLAADLGVKPGALKHSWT